MFTQRIPPDNLAMLQDWCVFDYNCLNCSTNFWEILYFQSIYDTIVQYAWASSAAAIRKTPIRVRKSPEIYHIQSALSGAKHYITVAEFIQIESQQKRTD